MYSYKIAIFVMVMFLGSALWAQAFEKTIKLYETQVNSIEELAKGVETSINSNDLVKFLSYFPIEYLTKHSVFVDMTTHIGCYQVFGNLQYSTVLGTDSLPLIFGSYSHFFVSVKTALVKKYTMSGTSVVRVENVKTAQMIEADIISAGKKSITFIITSIRAVEKGSIYSGKNGKYITFDVYSGKDLLMKNNVMCVEEIDEKLRLTTILPEVYS